MNLVGEALRPPFSTLHEWISVPPSRVLAGALALLLAVVLAANAILAERPPLLRKVGALLSAGVVLVALYDVAGFFTALRKGSIQTPAIIPASILVALFFAVIAFDMIRPSAPPEPGLGRAALRIVAAGALLASLPAIRMFTFGPTRYERRADCAVVFGARVWDDGTPSLALADRVDESIRLYHQGRVTRLVMSGGVDRRNGFSEADVMRDRAEKAGVPHQAILLDEEGVTTAATVYNVANLLKKEGIATALVVSHYYHEPRAKMLFDRAGVHAFTVPAKMTRRLVKEPYFIVREVAAYWHSFLLQ